ncbi:hypothetical protein DENSPDRAFT_818147 [Dentipellis sp. KUC8613]|nr:hypothetical protein DENSPDRAFT_818147 [Dentipellis sp. KUC8613]
MAATTNDSRRNIFFFATALTTLSVVSIYLTYTLFLLTRNIVFATPQLSDVAKPLHHYSYEGDDYPPEPALNFGRPVQMVMEDSLHYALDDDVSFDEWIHTSPYGTGAIRLGPEKRSFFVSMFHEIHCLRYFRQGLTDSKLGEAHLQHCFDYLRRMSLCQADLTLEPGDFASRSLAGDAEGATHVCRDWEAVYDMLKVNWVSWFRYRAEHNISSA